MSDRWKNNPWTDSSRVEELRRLWAAGMSAAKIAIEIGCGLTASAVIGKASRLKLTPRGNPATETRMGRREPGRTPKVRVHTGNINRKRKERNFGGVWGTYPDKVEPFVPRPSDIQILGLTILQVKDHQCKYIPGDDGICCGHEVKQDKPYCWGHCLIVYQGKSERSPAQKAADAKLGQRTARRTPDAQAWIAEEVA